MNAILTLDPTRPMVVRFGKLLQRIWGVCGRELKEACDVYLQIARCTDG